MAGFDKIKRKLICMDNDCSTVIFEDVEPIVVEYEKFYDDDEMLSYSNSMFEQLQKQLQLDITKSYILSIDTLGAYLNSAVKYSFQVKTIMECIVTNTNLDLEYSFNLPYVVYQQDYKEDK